MREDCEMSFCGSTKYLTVYVPVVQKNLAIKALEREHWSPWDNCIDHVVDALIAIGYPLPDGKNSFRDSPSMISWPYLFSSWVEKQQDHIPPEFLPSPEDWIISPNIPELNREERERKTRFSR